MKTKLLLLIFCLFVVSGCNNNKLVCEKKRKYAGYDYEEKYELLYDKNGEILKRVNFLINSKYNDFYTKEEIEKIYSGVLNDCQKYEKESEKQIKCFTRLDVNEISIEIKFNVDKINEDLFQKILYVSKIEFDNLNETKKLLENIGYKCK